MEHHHNSVRFRCSCGRLHVWRFATVFSSIKEIYCMCGNYHMKKRLNFRGEGRAFPFNQFHAADANKRG